MSLCGGRWVQPECRGRLGSPTLVPSQPPCPASVLPPSPAPSPALSSAYPHVLSQSVFLLALPTAPPQFVYLTCQPGSAFSDSPAPHFLSLPTSLPTVLSCGPRNPRPWLPRISCDSCSAFQSICVPHPSHPFLPYWPQFPKK